MDTSDIFVSVILPLRNNGAEIDDAVVALCDVLSRSFKDYELIIVDDGSTDGTSEAIAALQTKFPNIQSYTLGQRHGEDIATISIAERRDPIVRDAVDVYRDVI